MTDTEHRSPALSGNSEIGLTGREPVLKGVNSRIVADRSGAYFAESLSSLLGLMTEAQRQRFDQWNMQLLLKRLEKALPLFERAYPINDHPRQALRMTRHWIETPDATSTADRILALAQLRMSSMNVEGAAAFVAYAAFVTLNMTINPQNIVHLAREGIWNLARADGHADKHTLNEAHDLVHRAVKRAQLRAAYIIVSRT